MRAMILAAGLGTRLRPLTDHTPKPLLEVAGKCLIEYHLERLAALNVREVVINTHWLAEQIPAKLGNGEKWGLQLRYSHEQKLLETAGGIAQARPWQSRREPFLLINGDVYFEGNLQPLLRQAERVDGETCQAILAMTPNPPEHPTGDFVPLDARATFSTLRLPATADDIGLTYSGVSLLHPALFNAVEPQTPSPLAPLLRDAMTQQQVQSWQMPGFWLDVGTCERLRQLELRLTAAQ